MKVQQRQEEVREKTEKIMSSLLATDRSPPQDPSTHVTVAMFGNARSVSSVSAAAAPPWARSRTEVPPADAAAAAAEVDDVAAEAAGAGDAAADPAEAVVEEMDAEVEAGAEVAAGAAEGEVVLAEGEGQTEGRDRQREPPPLPLSPPRAPPSSGHRTARAPAAYHGARTRSDRRNTWRNRQNCQPGIRQVPVAGRAWQVSAGWRQGTTCGTGRLR